MGKPSYKRTHGLTITQRNALELVAGGLTDAVVADRIGVSPTTVTKWRLYDPGFHTAVNQRREELWMGLTDTVRALLPNALDSLREQLDIGPNRGRLALDFITRAGLMGKPGSGALGAAGAGANPANPAGIGFTRLEDMLDSEVRRARSRSAAETSSDTETGPITEEERQAAYDALHALAHAERAPEAPSAGSPSNDAADGRMSISAPGPEDADPEVVTLVGSSLVAFR